MNKLVAVTQLALCFVFVFCNSGDGQTRPAELVGQWEYGSGERVERPDKMELFKDGTGVVDGRGSISSWKVENKRFVILSSWYTLSCNYKISGYELTLIDDDGGDTTIFVRKGKLEEFKTKRDEAERTKQIAEAKKVAENAKASIGTFKDNRDGKSYKKVTIVGQTWMAENLNYAAEGSKCYDNKDDNCAKYGRLYDWTTAMKACPAGYHLSSHDEWETLAKSVGGSETAGKKLKSTSGWNDNDNGTDNYGFSALPSGNGVGDGSFSNVGNYGLWWSATLSHGDVRILTMGYEFGDQLWDLMYGEKSSLYSVRCVAD